MSQTTGGYIKPAMPAAIGTATTAAYLQPTVAGTTAAGGMNLLRPAGPRTNPNNLLAGGRVISERAVDINELLATGKLIEAPAVRDQAFRASAPMVSGYAAGPIATTAVLTAPEYANVEYITEPVVGGYTKIVAPAMTTEFVAAPMQYFEEPVGEVFVQ